MKKAVNAGWLWLDHNRERLNAINVFPVADGDTGTNMAQTLRSAAQGANAVASNHLGDVANSIAIYSLRGAQGNSGVILSQYFKGVADFIGGRKRLYLDGVAGAFSAGANSAYRAVKEPREGTILTVAREVAEHMQERFSSCNGLTHLLESALERGWRSVAATRRRLKALSDANVVDAGGMGFVDFIEGIYHLVKRGDLAKEAKAPEPEVIPRAVEEHSRYRYCLEFLVKGERFDTDAIKSYLESAGDSLIVACTGFGGQYYLRLHIHTDQPDKVEEFAADIGVVEDRKMDDMVAQNSAMRKWRVKLTRSRKQVIRIVTDSTCDLPSELMAFYDIEVVPLKVSFNERTCLDGVDLDADSFYAMLENSPQLPRTSQPSPGDFIERYKKILDSSANSKILSLHISSKLSGTYNSSVTAGAEFGKSIISYDTQTASVGLGTMTIAAAEMARDGWNLDEILARLDRLRAHQGLFFTLGSIEYLVRGGRIGKAHGFVGKLLGLKPILSVVDGEVVPAGKSRSEEKLIEILFAQLPEPAEDIRWAVAHARCLDKVEAIVSILRQRYKAGDVLVGELGSTVGTHAGPGAWGVYYMKG